MPDTAAIACPLSYPYFAAEAEAAAVVTRSSLFVRVLNALDRSASCQ